MPTPNLSITTPPVQHIRRLATATTLIAALSGCSPEESLDQGDPEDALSVEEPATGQATIQTIYGERDVTYEIINGRAIFEGDIDLGAVDENGELIQLRGATVDSSTLLWPNGDVPFQIDPGLVSPNRVTAAINIIEAQTSIRFRAVTQNDTDFINFTTSPPEAGGSFSPVGRQGGQQNVLIAANAGTSTVVHEILHSLGLYHEHTRSDRDDFVEVHYECVLPNRTSNYDTDPSNRRDLEPYDFNSIMHYSTGAFCIRDQNNNCICPTITLLDGVTPISASNVMGVSDINTLYRLYNKALGAEEANDRFGAAFAAGDFDDDGYQDLAVGSPFEEIGEIMSGAVLVYKGNSAGKLAPWMLLTQSEIGLDEEGDQFGSALAVGDFDNDGIDDLAVGAPGEKIGEISAGAVFLFEGSATGLSGWHYVHQATAPALGVNENGDGFGAALAAADFDLDGKDDLAIGAPWEDAEPILNNGWVFVFEGSSTGVVPGMGFGQSALETDETSDVFGYALAVGRLNNDSYWDLVVGSPEQGQGSGSAFVFTGSSTGLGAFDQLRQSDVGGVNEEDDYFGHALAIADFSGDGRHDLAVGAPGEDIESGNLVDAGQVYMFKPVVNSINGWHHFGQEAVGANESGDYFGASLAAGEVWNTGLGNEDDLVVGAPGEDIESASVTNAGAAFVFSGGSTDMVGRTVIYEDITTPVDLLTTTYIPNSESYDDFGRALCIGDFDGDGDGDLVVGVPLEDDDSGGIIHFPNFNDNNSFTYVMPIQQSYQKRLW